MKKLLFLIIFSIFINIIKNFDEFNLFLRSPTVNKYIIN